MARFAFAVPVLPGKQASSVAAVFQGRQQEYEESRARGGVTMERAYEMPTPMGSFAVAYLESDNDFATTMATVGASDAPIDRDFVAALAEVHGMDMSQPPPGPPPEEIAHWRDPQVSRRKPGLAFVAPVAPGRTDAGRAFAREAWVDRVDDYIASRRALGVCQESVFLNATPEGDVICVYLEGDDPAEGNRRFAASRSAYDAWFKEQCRGIFIPGVDFDEPLPPITTIWDWHRSPVTA